MSASTANEKRPSGPARRAINAGIAGALYGLFGGAFIAWSSGVSIPAAALICAIFFGLGEAFTDYRRQPGSLKPLAWRVIVSAFFGALFGGLVHLLIPNGDLELTGLLVGLILGILGLNWQSIALGAAIGFGVTVFATTTDPLMNPALQGALVGLFHRLLVSWLSHDREPISTVAERVPAAEIRYVVPFAAQSSYIGADYFKELARAEDGRFDRNIPEIGIIASMDDLRGPTFDPKLVDPLIREFYEHTSRFKLAIVPEWKPLMKPFYLQYKKFIAQRIGQANLPFDQQEAQRGVVSYIDTVEFKGEEDIVLRGWVRAFAETEEAIYVGIYTTFRDDERGYVSVGFPLPESNFTATLLPHNNNETAFLLTSRDTGLDYPGHYLSFFEGDDLTVLKLVTLGEEIEVYVREGLLCTDHRFYLGSRLFLTLYYTMQRVNFGG